MREINKQFASEEKNMVTTFEPKFRDKRNTMQYKVNEKRLDKLNRATSRAVWSKALKESKRIFKEKYSIQCLKQRNVAGRLWVYTKCKAASQGGKIARHTRHYQNVQGMNKTCDQAITEPNTSLLEKHFKAVFSVCVTSLDQIERQNSRIWL